MLQNVKKALANLEPSTHGNIEQQLRKAGKGYVLGVSSAHVFQSWGKRRSVAGQAADIARTRRSSEWNRLWAVAGTKGPRLALSH
jgi:SRSO17 transposase